MSNNIFKFTIRVPKSQSAFTYFQLESNEGLCFYSTLEESLGKLYRDIEICGPIEFKDEVNRLLDFLGKQYTITKI
ncbi:MAG: hypothetical protein H6622_14510 [Halobacteriovoraceae bacterium]|nr:hypothetical protein [Halobacteriovoraceae bacterium]